MIPLRQTVYRNLTKSNLVKTRVPALVPARFQSTIEVSPSEISGELALQKQFQKQPVKKNQSSSNSFERSNNNRKKLKPLNRKLKDITEQIRLSISSSTTDLTECIEILQEGLSYLREIQVAENISEDSIYSIFQPILNNLLNKALDDSVSIGSRSVDDILDLFVNYNVAHQHHFTKLVINELTSGEDKQTIYENVLKIWVKFIEYNKLSSNPLISKYYGFMRQNNINFNKHDLSHLAFYSYVQSCLSQDIKYNFKDALKLLQTEELPEIFQIRRTISSLNLTKTLKSDFDIFSKKLESLTLENLDPNGSVIISKINNAISHNDVGLLNKVYEQMQEASKKNNKAITENSLIRLMNGYYECKSFDNVFKVVQDMIQNGIEKPSIGSWEIVLRSMGHPSYINKFSAEQKKVNILNIERTIETMLNNGNKLTPKTLSIVIGNFANSDRFDKVDEYLQKYSNQGEGKLAIIHATKNNILIGLILNKNIAEAEIKLKEFVNDGSNYIPSSTTMNTFLNHYAKIKNYNAVDGILQFMKQNNIAEEIGTYTIVIDLYFKLHREKGLSPNVDQLLSSFTKSDAFLLNEYTFTTLIDGLVKDGTNLEAARILFEHASKKFRSSPQLLTSMLKGELDYGLIGNAELIFEKYIKTIRNDARIWNLMIKSLLSKHEGLAMEYYSRFKEQSKLNTRVEPNFYTYYFLLSHFIKRGNNEQIQFLVDELSDKSSNELGFELPRILRSLVHRFKFSENLLKQISKSS